MDTDTLETVIALLKDKRDKIRGAEVVRKLDAYTEIIDYLQCVLDKELAEEEESDEEESDEEE